jgi:hypothetical protein
MLLPGPQSPLGPEALDYHIVSPRVGCQQLGLSGDATNPLLQSPVMILWGVLLLGQCPQGVVGPGVLKGMSRASQHSVCLLVTC